MARSQKSPLEAHGFEVASLAPAATRDDLPWAFE
jgi:hypothetical protein